MKDTADFPERRVLALTYLRILLAGTLWFGSGVILWGLGSLRTPLDALAQAVAAIAAAALLIEAAALWRIRGLTGILTLAGLYGLAALLVEPSPAAIDLPRLLVTRGLGAHTLVGMSALALWLALLRGRPVAATVIGGGMLGLVGGIWSHALPHAPTLSTLMIAGTLGCAAIAGLWWLTASAAGRVHAEDLRLSLVGQLIAALALIGIVVYRLGTGALDPLIAIISATLMVFIGLLLRYQRSRRAASLLETALPLSPPRLALLLTGVAFLAGGVAGQAIPRTADGTDPATALGLALTVFGVVWLPAISFAIGTRAFLRQIRAQQL